MIGQSLWDKWINQRQQDLRITEYDYICVWYQRNSVCFVFNRPFARWRHFITKTRILQVIAFSCKLGLLLFKLHWDYKI